MVMVPLTEAADGFAARVIAARLGSEGIICAVRGDENPYPVGPAVVWVEESRLEEARALLLADEVEDSFSADDH
jgi:hypothetical protein